MSESEHDWFAEQIATHLAGGIIDPQERERFDTHARECAACAEVYRQYQQMEGNMSELFAAAMPDSDFENRVLSRWRLNASSHRKWISPLARKAAVAAAAVVVVAGWGYMGKGYIESGKFPEFAILPQFNRAREVSDNISVAPSSLSAAPSSSAENWKGLNGWSGEMNTESAVKNLSYSYQSAFNKDDSVMLPTDGGGGAKQQQLGAGGGAQRFAAASPSPSVTYSGGGRSAPEQLVKAGAGTLVLSGRRGGASATDRKEPALDREQRIDASSNASFKPNEYAKVTVPDGGAVQLGATVLPGEVQSRDAESDLKKREEDLRRLPLLGDLHLNDKEQRDQIALLQTSTQPAGGAGGGGTTASAAVIRHVIRSGAMEFEVDSYDSTFMTISKVVAEEGGFVSAADSDKLPNGKVRGSVTLRVPPDRLDTLVLKLRALGELKSQKLGSTDIGKEYTDLESQLRAARAMEDRLLEMIKTAQGKVTELLAAEKELGNWRTKIEQIQGQLNYYNNLTSMATLTVSAYEKDIRTAASAIATEEINAGVETEDVETARAAAIKSIDDVKGRIVESTLQKLEAGQFAARIVAEVAPENAGQLVDRLKQLGRVARLDIQRKQTESQAPGTRSLGGPPAKIEQAPTRLIISMYNLANVAPRLTSNLNLAAEDVESAYRAILKRVNDASGRVVSSSLNHQDATQAVGAIQFEVKAADADAILNDIRKGVQVLRLNVTENPDTANVTTAKQAFTVQIIPASQVPPREMRSLSVETGEVEKAVQNLNASVASLGGRVLESNLSQDGNGRSIAHLSLEIPLEKTDQLVDAAKQQGKVRTAESSKNTQVPEGPLARARINLTLGAGETIVPAEDGFWNSLRGGLSTSIKGLLWSFELIVIGLCLIGPWALLLWGGWKFLRRKRSSSTVV